MSTELQLCPEPCEKHKISPCPECFWKEAQEPGEDSVVIAALPVVKATPMEWVEAISLCVCSISAALCPIVWMILQTIGAFHHVTIPLDERILLASLAGWATSFAFGTRKKKD